MDSGHGPGPSGNGAPMHPGPHDAAYTMHRENSNLSQSPSWHGGYAPPPMPNNRMPIPGSPALSTGGDRGRDADGRRSADRNQSRSANERSVSGTSRICKQCKEPLSGQFVRALDGTFHLECFRCRDCNAVVASKFFPTPDEANPGEQYPLCEKDYFRRLDLLCEHCGEALRGSYITALDKKYHVDHFTCSLCSAVFGAKDSYYEHDGQVYCHYHYSTQFAQRCNGCQTAILKQFVEILRNGQNQHWHPECYMIHKFWNVRLAGSQESGAQPRAIANDDAEGRELVKDDEERMEDKVYRIWSVLSTFEESSAACISDMLLHVSNGVYVDGVMVAKRFILHVEILFQSADGLDATMVGLKMKNLEYPREAKLLCKKILSFFSLLSKTQDKGGRKLGVTQELLSLVTGLAHYLKLLIRICLQGALRIETEANTSAPLYKFLDDISDLDSARVDESPQQVADGLARLFPSEADRCTTCRGPIEDECAKIGDKRWHLACVPCSRCGKEMERGSSDPPFRVYDRRVLCAGCDTNPGEGGLAFERVTRLQQYVFILKVALARLLRILRNNGALPQAVDEARPNGVTLTDQPQGSLDQAAPHLRDDQRSKSHATGDRGAHQRESSYESTLNDVRRLRSTRLDKHLSSSFRKARSSRLMDDGQGGASGQQQNDRQPDVAEEGASDLMFGNQDALTLDDIPRIVAAEQAREQRPVSYAPPRQDLYRSPATEPGYSGSQNRSQSANRDTDRQYPAEPSPQRGGRRFFSELSGLEYFKVRHIAVSIMHPMVENEFTLEELLSFIETRKPTTFWNKFGKAFQKDNKKAGKKKGTFGVPLEVIIEKDGADSTDGRGPGTLRIPAIVDDLIATMKQMDLSVEGVFRKNGNIKRLQETVDQIDRDGCDSVDFTKQPVVQVAALFKRYLRELPDPLMTFKLHRLWVAAAKIPDMEKRRYCLHLVLCLLPKCHRDCLEILFSFLKWVATFHQVDEESGSKMDVHNLATVIAPNILYSNTKTLQLDGDPYSVVEAVQDLITYNEEMCLVPADILEILSDPSFFGDNGEITTKEILKRLGERQVFRPPQGADNGGGFNHEVMGRHNNSSRPLARRVETDPSVLQPETSVRTVQEPPQAVGAGMGGGGMPYANAGPNHTPPPPTWRPDEGRGSPYSHHTAGGDDGYERGYAPQQDERNDKRDWRNSGWGPRGNPNAVMGTP